MVRSLGQPSLAKLRPMGRARPGAVGLIGVRSLGQPSLAKLRPMGRARPGAVGLIGGREEGGRRVILVIVVAMVSRVGN